MQGWTFSEYVPYIAFHFSSKELNIILKQLPEETGP